MEEHNDGGGSIERRRIRPLSDRYARGLIDDFPTDKKGRSKVKSNIIDVADYCFKRVNTKGYVEDVMVEELQNIGSILRAYCEVEDGELWDEFNIFHIRFLEYLLREGLKYDKNLIIELFFKSGILTSLSIFIIQYKTYTFDINLILNYYDISVEAKNLNMLCFMTNQLCSRIKEIKKIKMEDLSVIELENAIRSGYFNDRKEELGNYLKELLIYNRDNDNEAYENLRVKLMKLHIMQELDICAFTDILEDHVLFDVMYHPWKVDFMKIPLNYFIGLRNINISNSVVRYGGYEYYLKIKAEKKKNRKIGEIYIFRNVLRDENFKRRYYEEKLAKEERKKKRRSKKGLI